MSTLALLSADWLLRGITIGLMLLIAAVLLRDYRTSVAARLTVAFSIGTTAYVICSGPASHPALWLRPAEAGEQLPLLPPSAGRSAY